MFLAKIIKLICFLRFITWYYRRKHLNCVKASLFIIILISILCTNMILQIIQVIFRYKEYIYDKNNNTCL